MAVVLNRLRELNASAFGEGRFTPLRGTTQVDGSFLFCSFRQTEKTQVLHGNVASLEPQLVACEEARPSAHGQHPQVLSGANAASARPRPAPGGCRYQQSVSAAHLHGNPAAPSIACTANAVPWARSRRLRVSLCLDLSATATLKTRFSPVPRTQPRLSSIEK